MGYNLKKRLLLIAVCISLATMTYATLQASGPVYKDPAKPVDERVEDLLGRMTLDEKVAQVMCVWLQKLELLLNEDASLNEEKAAGNLPHGIGQIGRPSEGYDRNLLQNRNAREMAEFTNSVQKYFVEKTRLGIPVVFHEECLHGHAAKDGTSFPQSIALAGTWDEDLVRRLFTMTALEARSRGAHQALTPVVDICREPRWGRVEETYGEDPYLVSRIGVAAVKGFQGEGPGIDKEHMIATLKHMTGHGQPEGGMNVGPANYSERIIREVFLPPFKACVQEAGALSVMASYNEVDGVPSHVNRWMLTDILRDEWGFDGYVVADYNAIQELYSRHRVAEDKREAAKRAISAGVDIELPDMDSYPEIKGLVESGELPMEVLDTAVRRLLKPKFLLGLFEDPYVDPIKAEKIVGSEENANLELVGNQNELARRIIELGKPVVVALFNGRPLSINYLNENVPAILECWYLGQESGNALADVIFGEVNPSGKLPISFARSVGHIPVFYNYKPSARRGYLFDDVSPLFAFGYGLSYTTFEYGNARLAKSRIGADEMTSVSVDIKNTGNRAGGEVVQMYIRDRVSSVTRPVKELKGFSKISLQPGEKKTVSLDITSEKLSFFDVDMTWALEPGDFDIMVGSSSRDEDLQSIMLTVQ